MKLRTGGPGRKTVKTVSRVTGGNTPPAMAKRMVRPGGNTPATKVIVTRTGGNTPANRNTGIMPPHMRKAARALDSLSRTDKMRKRP